ncbi:O-methyltransferase [Streptomyces violaceusniger]|nr:class I SAM-dependent methyltransferase [Streptomyces violaceusniger]
MKTLEVILQRELAGLRERSGKKALDVLEVGTIRETAEGARPADGWSTLFFAEHVAEHGGRVVGVDLDVSAARLVLQRHGVAEKVELVTGSSLEVLPRLVDEGASFDVIFLDSDNDPDLVMSEYEFALKLIRPGGLILADDVDQDDVWVRKGLKLIPYLKDSGVAFRIDRREASWGGRDVMIQEVKG